MPFRISPLFAAACLLVAAGCSAADDRAGTASARSDTARPVARPDARADTHATVIPAQQPVAAHTLPGGAGVASATASRTGTGNVAPVKSPLRDSSRATTARPEGAPDAPRRVMLGNLDLTGVGYDVGIPPLRS